MQLPCIIHHFSGKEAVTSESIKELVRIDLALFAIEHHEALYLLARLLGHECPTLQQMQREPCRYPVLNERNDVIALLQASPLS